MSKTKSIKLSHGSKKVTFIFKGKMLSSVHANNEVIITNNEELLEYLLNASIKYVDDKMTITVKGRNIIVVGCNIKRITFTKLIKRKQIKEVVDIVKELISHLPKSLKTKQAGVLHLSNAGRIISFYYNSDGINVINTNINLPYNIDNTLQLVIYLLGSDYKYKLDGKVQVTNYRDEYTLSIPYMNLYKADISDVIDTLNELDVLLKTVKYNKKEK